MKPRQTLEWLAKAARELSSLSRPDEILDFLEAGLCEVLPGATFILFSLEGQQDWTVRRVFGAEKATLPLEKTTFRLPIPPVPGHLHPVGPLSEWLGLPNSLIAHFLPFANSSGGLAILTEGEELPHPRMLETFAHQCAFFLRTKEPEQIEKTEKAQGQPSSVPLRVLVAEDNVINQKMTVRLLEKRGHQVTVVGNGLEAVEAWRRQPFDLILMDIQMPELGGTEAARMIRAEEQPGVRIPILAVTAHATWEDQSGLMDGFVLKPIQAGTLLREINNRVLPPASPLPPREDHPVILKDLDEELELIRELLYSLMEEVPRHVDEIKGHLAEGDAARAVATAQVVKGALGNFAADTIIQAVRAIELKMRMIRGPIAEYASGKAWAAAFSLELLARQGEADACEEAYSELEAHIHRLLAALKDFV